MKRAVALPAYRETREFIPPEGIASVMIDPETLQLAAPSCPVTREEFFLQGTQPTEFCVRHGGRMMTQVPPVSWLSRVFGGKSSAPTAPDEAKGAAEKPAPGPPEASEPAAGSSPGAASAESSEEKDTKKKGVLNRVFGIFGGGKKGAEKPPPKKKAGDGRSP
jgi:hypothetical protein